VTVLGSGAGTSESRGFLALPPLRSIRSSDSSDKKNPACAGSSSFAERSILLLSLPFFSAPHSSGFLISNSLLSVFLPVNPQPNRLHSPSSSSVHHHRPHEDDEDKATAVPEIGGLNPINELAIDSGGSA
jgi:hypothetical protein